MHEFCICFSSLKCWLLDTYTLCKIHHACWQCYFYCTTCYDTLQNLQHATTTYYDGLLHTMECYITFKSITHFLMELYNIWHNAIFLCYTASYIILQHYVTYRFLKIEAFWKYYLIQKFYFTTFNLSITIDSP